MQQEGGSQYGGPQQEIVGHFSSAGIGSRQARMIGIHGVTELLQTKVVAEAASPISSRPSPQTLIAESRSAASFLDELGGDGGGSGKRNFVDDEDVERGGGGGNRWPRQETLALLKIRSEMDVAFRDVTVKSPLWEDVSRKLAELGYTRSAKKCKEKFENVHKYYKRTKEGRAGRQDGKCYRFFSQLEALHNTSSEVIAGHVSSFASSPNINSFPHILTDSSLHGDLSIRGPPLQSPPPLPPPPQIAQVSALEQPPMAAGAGISFSSNTSSSSSSDSDGEDTDDGEACGLQNSMGKRKREWRPGGTGKTMAFFEGLMKQLLERQETMQQRFIDTIEKREQERMVREEAWKRQEMARLNREYELMSQERAMAANRDAAVISFLQKYAGVVTSPSNPVTEPAADPSQEVSLPPATEPDTQTNHHGNEIVIHHLSASAATSMVEMSPVVFAGTCIDAVSLSSSTSPSSRWPKTEVLALIKLRSALDTRYLEAGPKGPLWEEISIGMKRLGYTRSTKRCKEKWENINKYFKKVKEGNKKRPEDAKTCPYFHELDSLYRRKQQQENSSVNPVPQNSGQTDHDSNNGIDNGGNHEGTGFQMPGINTNGNGFSQAFFGRTGYALKKPEDIVKELMEQHQNHEKDEDDLEDDDDDVDYEDEDDEDGKMRYEIQCQRQSMGCELLPRPGSVKST